MDRVGQGADRFAGMLVAGVADECRQVEVAGALGHAVGDQDQAVTRLDVEPLHLVADRDGNAERQADPDGEFLDVCPAQPQRPGVAGVDEVEGARLQGDAQQLAGGHAAGVLAERLVGGVRLAEHAESRAARSAQGVDRERGQQGGSGVVPHRVGDRQVQRVVVQGEVVGVAADLVGRDQAAGEDELVRLAAGRRRQQLVLDLGGQAHGRGAPPPVVEVGEAAVGDHDVRQRVRGPRHRLADRVVRVRHRQVQYADAVAAVRHRRHQPASARPALLLVQAL